MTQRGEVVLGEPTVFRETRAILVESPFWHDGVLAWVDISTGQLHLSPADGAVDGSNDVVHQFAPPVSAVQPVRGGGWVLALGDRIIVADSSGREVRELAHIDHVNAGLRMNEGKCDPQGRFVVGSMNFTTGAPDGAWYRVDERGAETLFGGVSVANGLEWSLDEQTVYFTDTGVQAIYRAHWDGAAGPGGLAPFHEGSMSDGLVIDAEGYFWNGRYTEGSVVRLDPEGREVLRVPIPAPNVTGVTFGGDDLSTLYVGTARENLDEAALQRWPLSGSIFAVPTATQGRPVRWYDPAGAK